ncbi:3'-5' exonuclease [Marinomonas sp. TI.3.20]|uniref:3'-5' exonuclease n=1 Tax=Marinomonas sp. TI.3.20 TaxID=3121296 RepID=UPI00311DE9AC
MERPTKEQIKALPFYMGLDLPDIKIIESEEDAKLAVSALENEPCLGFDTETKPTFRKGEESPAPALIQLATESTGYLFPTRFSFAVEAARVLLTNERIQKVGFGIKDDNKALRNKLDIEIANTQDLSVVLKKKVGEKNTIGARAAVAMVLNLCLRKGAQISNWGAYPLKKSQVLYAANDAHSAICVAKALRKK